MLDQIAFGLALSAAPWVLAFAAPATGCTSQHHLDDSCGVQTEGTGDGVGVSVTSTDAASPSDEGASSTGGGDSQGEPVPLAYAPDGTPIYGKRLGPPGTPAPAPAALPAVVARTDIARFAPAPAGLALEPAGWSIANANLNAYATGAAVTQSVPGAVGSVPVTVVFTPVEYVWTWGDGSTSTSTGPGASWKALGVPDWSATETSHVYAERGDFVVTLAIRYSATVSAGGRVIPVDGLVTSPGTTAPVKVVESDRALVAATCLDDPNAPGC